MTMKGLSMQTSPEVEESLLAAPQPLSSAANEEFDVPAKRSTGWDPFEVWRTRIKAPQENLKPGVVA